jgi:hypothetical protein
MRNNGFHQIDNPIEPVDRKRAEQIGGGVFLVGLAVLFMTGDFFPGILIVIGLAALASDTARGKRWQSSGALGLLGLGLLFSFGFSFPLLLIIIGVALLMGYKGDHWNWQCWGNDGDGKSKNDFKRKRDNADADDVVVVGKSFQA